MSETEGGGGNRSSSNEESQRLSFRAYGIGIDTHRDFIVVTVLIRDFEKSSEKKFQKNFFTTMSDLSASRKWVTQVLKAHGASEALAKPLHYTIEATACYHYPVLMAWQGEPSVVNPNLLKAGRRKTDDIDSKTLAEMDLDHRWAATYLFSPDQMGLRVLLRMHHRLARLSGLWTKSLNSQLLKFGVTLSRLGSIAASTIRPVVEDLFHGKSPLLPRLLDCVPEKSLRVPSALAAA